MTECGPPTNLNEPLTVISAAGSTSQTLALTPPEPTMNRMQPMTAAPPSPPALSWPTAAPRIAFAKATAHQAASDCLSIPALAAGAPLGRVLDNGDGTVTYAPQNPFECLLDSETGVEASAIPSRAATEDRAPPW